MKLKIYNHENDIKTFFAGPCHRNQPYLLCGLRTSLSPSLLLSLVVKYVSGRCAGDFEHPRETARHGTKCWNSEWDFTLALRSIHTARPYKVLRQDSVYSVDNFFGGYIGIDDTRYLLHVKRLEAGVICGAYCRIQLSSRPFLLSCRHAYNDPMHNACHWNFRRSE